MTRVKRGIISRKRRQKILNMNKGFRGAASVLFRTANQRYMKSLKSAYENRHTKKRNFRRLWISRLNSAVRLNGLNYSQFVYMLKKSDIILNRKILSQLSICDPGVFKELYSYIASKNLN
jgi:large subunit ribosomal protein L20|nr:ribosomal protein L20 [Oedogonium sp. 260-2_chl]